MSEDELRTIVTSNGAEVMACNPTPNGWYVTVSGAGTKRQAGFYVFPWHEPAKVLAELKAALGGAREPWEPYSMGSRSRGGLAGGLDGSRWDD